MSNLDLFRIERQWMNSFSEKEFSELGLARYFPKIYRGLPRLYHRNDLSRSKIKTPFTNLSDLKRLSIERAVFSLYHERLNLTARGTCEGKYFQTSKIGIRAPTLASALEGAFLLAAKWPFLEIHLFINTFEELPNAPFPIHCPGPLLQEMALVVDLSVVSMGLHVLEKGIFTRKASYSTFAEIEQKNFLLTLFGTETPGPIEIDLYRRHTHFHFASLATSVGGAIYLHALLKMHERDEKDIDICSPDPHWLIQWLTKQEKIIVQGFGVKEICILRNEERRSIPLSDKGKIVRIIHPNPLSCSDLRRVISLSDDWIAVHNSDVFSEAISAKKAFFYDGSINDQWLVKDFSALAENRLGNHRSALHAFRMIKQAFFCNLPEESSKWVDESHFQREEQLPWIDIALELGASLQDGDAIVGFKKICRIISEEHSFNAFLCHLVERELFHIEYPICREKERQLIQLYVTDQISFSALVKNLQVYIYGT